MADNEQDILGTQKNTRWPHEDLKQLIGEDALAARRERDDLLGFLRDKVTHSFSGTKIHIGPLSPGCRLCGEGSWSCMFINHLCTANCFFCPQDRKVTKEELPCTPRGFVFDEPGDYADFLTVARHKGVGFSGGEPLLVFDRLLAYIKTIREKKGDDLYLWMYTNGDLADEEKLHKLRESGLDEIRFNTSAGRYGLENVKKAVGIIDTVTVEIPAIPEDYDAVKRSLIAMQKIGVSHVNIHQLIATKHNYKNFMARGYTFLRQASISILESELMALRLLQYAVKQDLSIPINYCSSFYKDEFQHKGERGRLASLIKEASEELTEAGYIRRLTVRARGDAKEEVVARSSLLRTLDLSGRELVVSYFEPSLRSGPCVPGADRPLAPHLEGRIYVKRELSDRLEITDAAGVNSFLQLLLDKKDETSIRQYFCERYELTSRDDAVRMREAIDRILSLKRYERIGAGFPEIR